MSSGKKHIYFKGLNGLRFFAAIAVVFTHIELMKSQYGFENLWKNKLFFELGGLGVVFFFVLSGFLITYLLLEEKQTTKTISITKFYVRRILRIWPLYFFIMLIGFFILPNLKIFHHPYLSQFFEKNFIGNLMLYIFLFPNLALALYKPVPHIGQLWSIGVEEQFYVLWPVVVKWSRNLLKTLISIILISVCLKLIFNVFIFSPQSPILLKIKIFIATLKFESMAIGGIGAWCLHQKKYFHLVLNNMYLVYSILIVAASIYFTPPFLQDGIFIIQSFLFLIIILNVSCNPKSILKLENKLFVFLGNISYGLYMYHLIVVVSVILILQNFNIEINNRLSSQVIIYSLSIGLTILISWLSYVLFEKYFIKLKRKSTVIHSGSN